MSVQVRMFSVYVQNKGVRLFDAMAHAIEFQQGAEKSGLFAWGVGKHVIEVIDAISLKDESLHSTTTLKEEDQA